MRIGFVTLPLTGHLNPMTALAHRLLARGHDVVFIGYLDDQPKVAPYVPFQPYCEDAYPLGSIAPLYAALAPMSGVEALRYNVDHISKAQLAAGLVDLPVAISKAGVQLLVLDGLLTHGPLVALRLGIPFIQVCNALNIDTTGITPPTIFDWEHLDTPEARARNFGGLATLAGILAPLRPIARTYAEEARLPVDLDDPDALRSTIAVISQMPEALDFHHHPVSDIHHYTGPFIAAECRPAIPFPWQRLSDRPIVYASLGTVANGRIEVVEAILEATRRIETVQLVLSVGANLDMAGLAGSDQDVVLVRQAPQLESLARASLCLTHGGLNTVLEALACGVPLVAIPIMYDQPGTAARVVAHRLGEMVSLADLTVDRLEAALRLVLSDPTYRRNAGRYADIIAARNGLDAAATLIERGFRLDGSGARIVAGDVPRAATRHHAM